MSEQKQPQKPQADNRTASQKISQLERSLMQLYSISDNMARDLGHIKEALKLLNNKLSSLAQAVVQGEEPTEETLSKLMTNNNVLDLAKKVETMVNSGILVKEEQVSENSFIVAKEVDQDGKEVNPRLQFALQQLQPEHRGKILGLKAGESVQLREGGVNLSILESYSIHDVQDASEAPAEAPVAEAPAPEAQDTQADPTPAV